MKMIHSTIRCIGACIISLLLLSCFVLIYSYSGTHIENETGATDYKWLPGQYKANMVEGFSWLRMDDEGFNNADCSKNDHPDVLLMGSSHLEAINVSDTENTLYYLSKFLPDYKVYNIGVSGHNIYRCANNLSRAIDYYSPEKYIVIETATISLDNDLMNMVIDGALTAIPSFDSGVLFHIQKYCPAIKNIYNSLTNWRNVEKKEATQHIQMDFTLLDEFIHFMSNSLKNDCKLIIIYHPTSMLDANGNIVLQTSDIDLQVFRDVCEKYEIEFVDTSMQVIDLFNKQHKFIHGFSNTAIGSGHLNRYGHFLLAKQLELIIKEKAN